MLAVLLYNMAVANHQLGLKLGVSSKISRALHLYQLSLTTLENLAEDSGFDGALLLLLCGLYNNMGHCHAFFFERHDTVCCIEWLQTILHAEEFATEFICEEEYDFFSQYLLLRSDEKLCVAPAA
jgi:hypothetical protein